MKIASALLLFVLAISCSVAATPGAPPPQRGAPGAPGAPMMSPFSGRALPIGPNDSTGYARTVRGKVSVLAYLPTGVQPASVVIFADGKQVGTSSTRPYRVEVDTSTLSDGDHLFKAVGRDASGKDIWTCTAKAKVSNTQQSALPMPGTRNPGTPFPGMPGDRKFRPGRPTMADSPGAMSKPVKNQPRSAMSGPPVTLDRTYTSDDYGFSIQYPGDWTFKDKTVMMKPMTEGACWLAFAAYPIEKSKLVVNVRRVKLEPGTDAQTFSKYNSYVLKWDKRTLLDCPAYQTTSKMTVPKKVIHRMIVIMDGSAWMLNCEDSSGKPADASAGLFESMINSLRPIRKPATSPAIGHPVGGHGGANAVAPPPVSGAAPPAPDAPPPPPPQ